MARIRTTKARATAMRATTSPERRTVTRLRAQTFGACMVSVGDTWLGPDAGTQFSLLLLLLHSPLMRMQRSALLDFLWPQTEEARRRGNLRQILYRLRKLNIDVSLDGEVVCLNASQVERNFSIDRNAERFERDVATGIDPFGAFLPGFVPTALPAFREWVEQQRAIAHADARRVLIVLLQAYKQSADWKRTEDIARKLLQFDALNEAATLALAECAAFAGGKVEAVGIIDRYLEELGPGASDIRVPATILRRRIAEPRPRRLSFAPTERHFIGRDRELADLTLCVRRSRWNDGGATLLHGPAGIGKTRLTEELGNAAQIDGFTEVHACCRESDVGRALSVFAELLPSLLTLRGAIGCSPEAMRCLRRLANRDEEPNDAANSPDALPVISLAAALRRSIVELLTAIAEESPLLIVLEDVHWIDAASWEVVVDLVNQACKNRFFLLMTSRTPHARPQRPERIPEGLVLHSLQPLSDDSSLALARAIGDDLSAIIDDRLGEWFVSASEGLPLFLRSLVNHWIETGDAGGVPPTLTDVIERRFEKLSQDAQRVLQCVALLGRHASAVTLSNTLDMPTHTVLNGLDALSKVGAFSPSKRQAFACHDLIARMAIASLSEQTRRVLHCKVADVLLEQSVTVPSTMLLVDALTHIAASDDWDRFNRTGNDSAQTLLESGRPFEALAIVEQVLRTFESSTKRNELLALQAEALYQCGEFSRLVTHPLSPRSLRDGVESFTASSSTSVLQWIEAAFIADKGENANELGLAATLLAESREKPPELRLNAAMLAIRIVSNTSNDGLASRAYVAGKEALPRYDERDPNTERLDMLYHTIFGDVEKARLSAQRLCKYAQTISALNERLALQSQIAFALRCAGEVALAHELLVALFREAESAHNQSAAALAAARVTLIALDEDNLPAAEFWSGELRRVSPVDREPLAALVLHLNEARIFLQSNNTSAAEGHMFAARSAASERGHAKRFAYYLALQLNILRVQQNADRVEAMLADALPLFQQVKRGMSQDYFASQLTMALAFLKRTHEARELLEEYIFSSRRERYAPPRFLGAAADLVNLRSIGHA